MRMIQHLENYTPSTFYAVVRADVWRRSHESYVRRDFPVPGLGELQFELSTSFHGKSRVLPLLHWLRSFENGPIMGTDVPRSQTYRFWHWWCDPGNSREKAEFVDITSECLGRSGGVFVKDIGGWIVEACDAYVRFNESTRPRDGLRTLISKRLPRRLKDTLRSRKRGARRWWEGTQLLSEVLGTISKQGIRYEPHEVERVESAICAFHGILRSGGQLVAPTPPAENG